MNAKNGIERLSTEELERLLENISSELMKRKKVRLRKWIEGRIEHHPEIRAKEIYREIEKIFNLPLSLSKKLREEVWKEFRKAKVRHHVKAYRSKHARK